eukprot:939761-Ditylum_brightwellii.AAC.1
MALAAEAKIGALYANARKGEELQTALEEMGHPQLLTPIMTDNTTANRIVNDMVKRQRSCAIDMRFYWLRDRCQQGHFQVYWRPCNENLGDHHTCNHLVSHHREMQKYYVHVLNHLDVIRAIQICKGVLVLTLPRSIGPITLHAFLAAVTQDPCHHT